MKMAHGTLSLALGAWCMACVAMATVAGASVNYEWKSQDGGLVDPALQMPLFEAKAYLFDANVCSQGDLVEKLKKGYPLRSLPFVLAKDVAGGTIATGAAFAYDGEPVGVAWNAYMAVQLENDVYISPAVETMGLAMGLSSVISFENLLDSSSTFVVTESYTEPGWYSFEGVAHVLQPGKGIDELEVAAGDAATAVELVTVMSPDADIVSDADYLKYFKLTATPTTAGMYLVRAELDAEKIDLDKTVVSFAAQLADLAKKAGTTVTVEIECKPGLSYRVITASAVAGPYAKGEAAPLSTGTKTEIKVALPKGDKAFFKIGVQACPEEVK